MNNNIPPSLVVETSESPILIRRRKIFGTCKGCNQPNTNFNECQSCIKWLNEQETSFIDERKSLTYNQSCFNCNQPKHIHYKIAACNNCGFPEYSVRDLCQIAIEDIYDEDDYDYEGDGIKISDLLCSKCDYPMTSWLKCPDYNEVIDMICLELNEMNYDDPDYQKLWDAKEYYEELFRQEQEDEYESEDDDEKRINADYNSDYDDYDDDDEYEQYDEIIDPKTVLSILGLQKQYQYYYSSSLRARTNFLSLYLSKKN